MTFRERGRVRQPADAPSLAAGYAEYHEKASYGRGYGGGGGGSAINGSSGLHHRSSNVPPNRQREYEYGDEYE